MQMPETKQDTAGRVAALMGRVLIASLFLISAVGKLTASEATQGYIAAFGLPMPELVYVGTVGFELASAVLLILGWHTRAVAGLLLLFTLVTAAVFHAQFGNQNEIVHFLKNLAIAGGLLHVTLLGGGAWSVDGRAAVDNRLVPVR